MGATANKVTQPAESALGTRKMVRCLDPLDGKFSHNDMERAAVGPIRSQSRRYKAEVSGNPPRTPAA